MILNPNNNSSGFDRFTRFRNSSSIDWILILKNKYALIKTGKITKKDRPVIIF